MNRPKYFTPAEVAAHNSATDLWVSFLGKVWDLTPLVSRHEGEPGPKGPVEPGFPEFIGRRTRNELRK